MPNKSDQSMVRLPLEAQFLSRPVVAMEEPEAATITTFAKGFDGHKKLVNVLRQLDEEIAILVYQERVS